jgi:hypothetical protein
VLNLLVSISLELVCAFGSRKLASNSIQNFLCYLPFLTRENQIVQFAKPEHTVLAIEFSSGFFVNLLLGVLQVVGVA